MKKTKNKALIFANIVLSSAVILFILLIFYLWYRSSSFLTPLNLKLLVISIAGILFSIVTFFLPENRKITIAITVLSIVIAVYGIESVLFFLSQPEFSPSDIDMRTRLEVVEDLRAEGIDAWPSISSSLFIKSNGILSDNNRFFPLGGISQKTIVYCNTSGHHEILESDEHGFNNPEGLYKKGAIDAALVGDYFAFGHCGISGEDIGNRLRYMELTPLNLGNGNNGPLINLAILKEYLEVIRSPIVLWVYFEGNDLHDIEVERTSSILMNYLEDGYSQNLLERQDEIDAALIKNVNSNARNSRFIRRETMRKKALADIKQTMQNRQWDILKLKHLRDQLGLINKSDRARTSRRITNYKSQLPLFSEIVLKAHKRTSDWGGKFYFVYVPTIARYVADNDAGSLFDRDDVLTIVHKLGISVIDFHEVLKKHPDPLSLSPFFGAHYDAKSYDMVLDLIISRLTKDGLISGE